jgi:hypothetical protein
MALELLYKQELLARVFIELEAGLIYFRWMKMIVKICAELNYRS